MTFWKRRNVVLCFIIFYRRFLLSNALPNLCLFELAEYCQIITSIQFWSLLFFLQSLITVGAIFGSPLAGWAIDKLGRKSTIMLCVVPFVLGWLLIGFAQNLAMLYSGRVISGLACGVISVTAPVSSILSQASACRWRVKKHLRKNRRGLRKKCMILNKYIHCSSKLTLDSVHANGAKRDNC